MKEDKKNKAKSKSGVQDGSAIKKDMPVKNKMTNSIKNTAAETPGLSQSKTTRDDLFPSDGDDTNI